MGPKIETPKIVTPPPEPAKPFVDEEEIARQRRAKELSRTGVGDLRIDPGLPKSGQGTGLRIPT